MTNTPMTKEDVLLDLYKIYAYNPNDAVGNPLTPFGNFCEGYQASQAQQASEIEALKHDLYSYMEASNGYVNEIMKQAQTIAELVEALEMWAGLINYQYTGSKEAMSALQICDDFGQEVLAKVKGK